MDHVVSFAVLLADLRTHQSVAALALVTDRFPDIVQQGASTANVDIRTEFLCDPRAEMRHFQDVGNHVLAERVTVFHPSQQFDQFWMQVHDTDFETDILARLPHNLFDFFCDLVVQLFDPAGMDPSVVHQMFEHDPGDFTANRVEARDHNRLGRVVDHDIHTGHRLERADIPALASDDTAFDLLRGQDDRRNTDFGGMVRCAALDRRGQNFARFPISTFLRIFGDGLDDLRGFTRHVRFERPQEKLFRFVGGQA